MISVVICTYNRAGSLDRTLESLGQMTVPEDLDWELIIVDNRSVDGTKELVQEFLQRGNLPLRYVFEEQQGQSYARNTGILAATGEIIVFTDDDVTVDSNWLASTKKAFDKHECRVLGGRIVDTWPCSRPAWYQEDGPFATAKAIVRWDLGENVCKADVGPYGANMAFKREIFTKYGLFRTDLGRVANCLTAGEDIEFIDRLRNGGEEPLYIPDAVVFHPVTDERTRKGYFQRWCFDGARSQVRLEGPYKNGVCYFGIPRYCFRALFERFVMYFFAVEPKRRFFHKLEMYRLAGRMVESRRLRRAS